MDTEKQGFFRDIKQLGEEYVNERINLIRLQGAEKAARMSAVIATGLILGVLCFFALLFISLIGVYAMLDLTGNIYLALGMMALLYLLLAMIVYLNRNSRFYPMITNAVIKMLFEKSDHEQ